MATPKTTYRGCIFVKPVAEYSYKGWQGNRDAKTSEQNVELTQDDLSAFISTMANRPVCFEHRDYVIGRVTKTWQKPDQSVWVEFHFNDDQTSEEVEECVKRKLFRNLSWTWDWRSMEAIEVSIVLEPAIPGTCIEDPANSSNYIQPDSDSASRTTPHTSDAAAERVRSLINMAAPPTNGTAPAATEANAAAPPAGATKNNDVSMPDLAAATTGAKLPVHPQGEAPTGEMAAMMSKLANTLQNSNMLDNDTRNLIGSVVAHFMQGEAASAEAALKTEYALKDSQNEIAKLRAELSKHDKSKEQTKRNLANIVEGMIKQYAPHMLPDVENTRGTLLEQNDTDGWLHSNAPAIQACSLMLNKQAAVPKAENTTAATAPPSSAQTADSNASDQNINRYINLIRAYNDVHSGKLNTDNTIAMNSALTQQAGQKRPRSHDNDYNNGSAPSQRQSQEASTNGGWKTKQSVPAYDDPVMQRLWEQHAHSGSGMRMKRDAIPSAYLQTIDALPPPDRAQ